MSERKEFTDLLNQIMSSVTMAEDKSSIEFKFLLKPEVWRMEHQQDCCESVAVEDIAGDLQDLVGAPLLMAEEVSHNRAPVLEVSADSYTWTFYKFRTVKGSVTIRWLGTSNGYYSESVNFERVER